ncbi:phosphotransferase family protein [Patulibacter sp.]|uniref:phosphotransferase family protein n=1 Tax=Patulibacter sp. TaxID=1912859 RepID=UPI00271A88D2|nr:phosphotransferase family protein [Patulibacter sp.]MDO9410900.1 phosphotransferase family protein [Patulibacter sp.]
MSDGTQGPTPPMGPSGIDVPKVTAWLQDVLPAAAAPFTFTRIGDGRSNLTFRVADTAGAAWILRRPPLGPRLRGAHDMVREHRLLAALHPAGVRVPEPLGLCEDEAVTGAPFYLMELAEGTVVTGNADLEAFSPEDRATASRSMVAALAELHAVDVDAVGLGDLSRHEGYAERQLKGWWRQWEASKTREVPAIDRVRDLLAAAVPDQRRVGVVHGDYKLENVVLGADGEVVAILDWELCTLGDPVADLGTLMTYWIESGDPSDWALGGSDAPTSAEGFLTRAEMAEAYSAATGDPLDGLPFFEAQGCWKLAIILQGVIRRFRDTPENANADPDVLEPTLDSLADRAERIATTLRG